MLQLLFVLNRSVSNRMLFVRQQTPYLIIHFSCDTLSLWLKSHPHSYQISRVHSIFNQKRHASQACHRKQASCRRVVIVLRHSSETFPDLTPLSRHRTPATPDILYSSLRFVFVSLRGLLHPQQTSYLFEDPSSTRSLQDPRSEIQDHYYSTQNNSMLIII